MPKKIRKIRRRLSNQDKHALVVRYRTRPKDQSAESFAKENRVSMGSVFLWNKDKRFADNDPVGTARGKKIGVAVKATRGRKAIIDAELLKQENDILRPMVVAAIQQGFLRLYDLPFFKDLGPLR
jgi:hypothetical protein